jgi:hypothetical protein
MNKITFFLKKLITSNDSIQISFLLVAFVIPTMSWATITINGESHFCSSPQGLTRNYVIVGSGETCWGYRITVTGGTISNISEDVICTNPYRPDVIESSSTTIVILVGETSCSYWEISFDVTWGSGSNRKVEVKRDPDGTKVSKSIVAYSDSGAYIDGQTGYVCQSFTGGLFSATNVSGVTSYVWSSTSTGSSLSIPSGSSCCPYITGFTPNNMYTLNCSLYCNGVLKKVLSSTIFTVNSCRLVDPKIDVQVKEIDRLLSKPQKLLNDQNTGDNLSNFDLEPDREIDQFSVFPIPSSIGYITYRISDDQLINQVELYDLKGRLLYFHKRDQYDSTNIINTSELPPGTYVLRFRGPETDLSKKVVIAP